MTTRVLTRDPRGYHALELLDAFIPGDARERTHHARMLELLATTSAPFARDQFDPGHFTASALVISRDAGQVLLIHHPTLALWLQPGGHIEPGDATLVDAAHREVLEETGLDAIIEPVCFDLDVHEIPARGAATAPLEIPARGAATAPLEIPARGAAPTHLHHDLRFLALVHGLPAPESAERLTARWLSPRDAAALTTDESVRRMLRKAFPTTPNA
jgi:8-oxo-dGTP pyrophosphatase MutT (NUDIX family)